MAKQHRSFFSSPLGARCRSPLNEFGSHASYSLMGRITFSSNVPTVGPYIFRYEDDHWTRKEDAPRDLWNHVAWGFLGRMHYAWGHNGFFSARLDHTRYDGRLDAHETLPDAPERLRVNAVVFTIGSRAHVTTGLDPSTNSEDQDGRLRTHDSWIETNESWVRLAPITGILYRTKATAFTMADKGYVVGGNISRLRSERHAGTNSNRTGQNSEYTALTDTWAEREWFPNLNLHLDDQDDWADEQASAVVYQGSRGFCWNGKAAFAQQQNWAHHYSAPDDAWTRHEDVPEESRGSPFVMVMPRVMSAVIMSGDAHLIGGGLQDRDPDPDLPHERLNIRFNAYTEAWWWMSPPLYAKDWHAQVAP